MNLSFFNRLISLLMSIVMSLGSTFSTAYMNILKAKFTGNDYTIPEIDLSVMPEGIDERFKYLYDTVTIDDTYDYMAHPDSVLRKNGDILTLYPAGHGKGAVLNRVSADGGITWSSTIENTPKSWENSLETPTVYRLQFTDGKTGDKLIMISGNPKWPRTCTPGGFNCSVSTDEGQTWSEFELFYSKKDKNTVIPIVAMASLTQLKENGKFVDKWMGLFHDKYFHNYKSILSFDENGRMHWSKPEKYFKDYRLAEYKAQMCEVEVIRSNQGHGDELCLIARSNSKKENGLISFSQDEGKTWSEPKHLPAALNGERYKAKYTKDGRLFITFRSVERGQVAASHATKSDTNGWLSEGWVAWVGTYDDLKNGTEGQYRIKLAHTYLDGQSEPQYSANADTGYCGNVVLNDGTIVTSSYGKFSPTALCADGSLKTYIVSKRIRLEDTDKLLKWLQENNEYQEGCIK